MQLSCLLIVALAVVSVTPAPQMMLHKTIPLVASSGTTDMHGQYALSFLTGEGLSAVEQGYLKPGKEGLFLAKKGTYSYISPEGLTITTSYVADEGGFMVEGTHLPVPVVAIH